MSHAIPAGGARAVFRPPVGGVASASSPANSVATQGPRPIGRGDVPAHAVMPVMRKPGGAAEPGPPALPDGA